MNPSQPTGAPANKGAVEPPQPQPTIHRKPRGRPPKGKVWNAFIGEYVPLHNPPAPPPPPPQYQQQNRTTSNHTSSRSQSWNSEEMMEIALGIGRKQNPYRECTRNMRDASGQYKSGFYNPEDYFDFDISPPNTNTRRSISDQGTRVFANGLNGFPEPLHTQNTRNGPAEVSPFLEDFEAEMQSWYERKSESEKAFLNTSNDVRLLMRVMTNSLDNYLYLNGHGGN